MIHDSFELSLNRIHGAAVAAGVGHELVVEGGKTLDIGFDPEQHRATSELVEQLIGFLELPFCVVFARQKDPQTSFGLPGAKEVLALRARSLNPSSMPSGR